MRRYAFTRISGAIIAGVGWVILVGNPVVAGLVIIVLEVQSQALPPPRPEGLLFAAFFLASLIVAFIVGGAPSS